jgi:hypothetical protein
MDLFEHPSEEIWNERQKLFEKCEEEYRGEGSYIVSDQACALIAEVECVFCAGAWVAVIILTMAVIDAQLRETEVPDFEGNTADLINLAGANQAIHDLRKRRNKLIHIDVNDPAITVDQQWENRDTLESEAREAIELMFETFYIGPWI